MLNPRYAFISACLKGEEVRIVSPEHIDKMATVPSLQDALAVIRETDVGDYLEGLTVKTFDDLDVCLWKYLAQCIRWVQSLKLTPKEIVKLSRAYVVKYDISNVKAALRGIALGKKASMIPVGIIADSGLLDALSNAETVDDVTKLLASCKLDDYVPVLEQYKGEKGIKYQLLAEAKLDGQYYRGMLNLARKTKDGAVLARALGVMIDLTNLQIAIRAIIAGLGAEVAESIIPGGSRITDQEIKELLLLRIADLPSRLAISQYRDIASEVSAGYDRTRSITVIDETIDKHKFRLLRELLSPRVLSPLVIVWYLVLKEVEIRNLRLALKALADGVPIKEIRNYLTW